MGMALFLRAKNLEEIFLHPSAENTHSGVLVW